MVVLKTYDRMPKQKTGGMSRDTRTKLEGINIKRVLVHYQVHMMIVLKTHDRKPKQNTRRHVKTKAQTNIGGMLGLYINQL